MIEEQAQVLESIQVQSPKAQALAKVKVQRKNACESCAMKSGCGQSAMTKLSASHCLELNVGNQIGALPGDIVIISVPESGAISASLRVYFLPLILLMLGAIMGNYLDAAAETTGEIWTVLFSMIGLATGFIWANLFGNKKQFDSDYLPEITKILNKSSSDL